MEKPDLSPMDLPSRLRMRTQAEWKVETHMRWATGPIERAESFAHFGGGLVGEGDG